MKCSFRVCRDSKCGYMMRDGCGYDIIKTLFDFERVLRERKLGHIPEGCPFRLEHLMENEK